MAMPSSPRPMGASPSYDDDRDAWIRVKLLAGLALNEAERAYLASLPPGDALRRVHACPRKAPS